MSRLVRFQVDGLGTIAVQLEWDLFHVQDDVGGVFHHAGDRLELVQHAFDLDGGHGCAFNRRQQHAPEGVADGCAEASFKRLRVEAAVFVGQCLGIGRETLGFLKSSPKNHFSTSFQFRSVGLRRRMTPGCSGAANCWRA